jgi:hypothetical protein
MEKTFYEVCIFNESGILVFYDDFLGGVSEHFTERMAEEKEFENRMSVKQEDDFRGVQDPLRHC